MKLLCGTFTSWTLMHGMYDAKDNTFWNYQFIKVSKVLLDIEIHASNIFEPQQKKGEQHNNKLCASFCWSGKVSYVLEIEKNQLLSRVTSVFNMLKRWSSIWHQTSEVDFYSIFHLLSEKTLVCLQRRAKLCPAVKLFKKTIELRKLTATFCTKPSSFSPCPCFPYCSLSTFRWEEKILYKQ